MIRQALNDQVKNLVAGARMEMPSVSVFVGLVQYDGPNSEDSMSHISIDDDEEVHASLDVARNIALECQDLQSLADDTHAGEDQRCRTAVLKLLCEWSNARHKNQLIQDANGRWRWM